MTFRDRSTPAPMGPGRFRVHFDDTWRQGPGVYGGLSAAALYRACAATVGERPGQRLRSMALQYLAPVAAAEAELEVRVEREGTGSTFVSGRLTQGGQAHVTAMTTFGRDRPSDLDEDRVALPPVPPPDRIPTMPYVPGAMPVFLQHFELRFAEGAPFGGAAGPRVGAWLRFRDPPEAIDVAHVLGLLDTPPPAILTRASALRPASTVSFQIHLLRPPPPEPAGAFWYVEVTSAVTLSGWSDEELRLFGPDGRAVAIGRQLVAVVR